MAVGIGPADTDLGHALKWWVRRGPRQQKVAALAHRVGVSQSTLYAYLAGTTVPPSEILDDLLHHLGVPPEEQRRLATARDALQVARRGSSATPEEPPRELPPDASGFTGREQELAALDDALADRTAAPLAVVCGPAGVGKTALATHWGHTRDDQFPGGSVYVDLRGWSVDEPLAPREALARILRRLGAGDDLPDDLDGRSARFRSLADRRGMLVVLDNALDPEQVRPLVPGPGGSFAVVTSRSELTGLLVRPGAHPIEVSPLDTDAAVELLGAQVPESVRREPDAARELALRCGGLPLALRVVAARARVLTGDGLESLVVDLDRRPGLDRFEVGDDESSLRRVFSWSELRLPHDATEAFRLLGVLSVPDVDLGSAAALFGCDEAAALSRLDALVRAHLVTTAPGPRFGMHDLLRQHAVERAADELCRDERSDALTRVVDHLVSEATHAVSVLHPPEDNPGAEAARQRFPRPGDAQAWLDHEWAGLVSLVSSALELDRPRLAGALIAVLRPHLDQGGRHQDAVVVLEQSLRVDRRLRDKVSEAATLRDLGTACMRLGRHEEATGHFVAALDLARAQGDRNGEAGTLNNLGNLLERLGRYDEAIDHYELALPIVRVEGYRKGEATLHNNLGWSRLHLGGIATAERDFDRALALFEEIGDLGGAARTRGNLGRVHLARGRHTASLALLREALIAARALGAAGIETEVLNGLGHTLLATGAPERAVGQHESALTLARASGDRFEEAMALEGIGHAHRAAGDLDNARGALTEALRILESLGLGEADRVAHCLTALESSATG